MMNFLSPRHFLWLVVLGIALGLLLTSLSGTKIRSIHAPLVSFNH